MSKKRINELVTIRQQQAYGAVCLSAFCRHFSVAHKSIIALINHLFFILKTDDLPGWEDEGTQLDISCFGDPLPGDVKSSFAPEIADLAEEVIDRVSVIGVVDMYGAITGRSGECLNEAIEFIESANVNLPLINHLVYEDEAGWGTARTEDDFKEIKSSYSGYFN